jgi:hypothetical protein
VAFSFCAAGTDRRKLLALRDDVVRLCAADHGAPGSLTNDEVYAVTAHILAEAKIVDVLTVLDSQMLPKVVMSQAWIREFSSSQQRERKVCNCSPLRHLARGPESERSSLGRRGSGTRMTRRRHPLCAATCSLDRHHVHIRLNFETK